MNIIELLSQTESLEPAEQAEIDRRLASAYRPTKKLPRSDVSSALRTRLQFISAPLGGKVGLQN